MPHFQLTPRLRWGLHLGAVATAGIVLSACSSSTDGDQPDFSGDGGMTTVESTTETSTEETSTATKSPETQKKEPPVVTVTETEQEQAQPPKTTNGGGNELIDGLGEYGWTDTNTYANCHRYERVVFAGKGPDGRAIICENQGNVLTYRSTIFGGEFTGSIIGQDGGNYYVDASPSTIVVTPSGISVREGGGLAATADFDDSWQR
ncbi:hypothetical protein ACUY26_08890 [Corynebacterium segmentosum]|uniref:Uncharacterized protein n=1 Tax=Corynebacterium accolens TaxID=38284 RepID=A0ABT7FQE9_9CORY|nr:MULTISPECIES: hypothetical protein [Corynebacterium]ERS57976.1 hypothetical protein HMPREF1261_02032 [Corynebacterium sp. KPL1818]MDK4209018.1 hypothetical protein [Corynebacterium accolens]MDK4233222.1 hypothetical protein [Corynebacterium accolens]MDK4247632.1 hypothetical protein [Corynebacterium accolens]MDK4294663.1 hypothetical protein [Corynebacterium accolens]